MRKSVSTRIAVSMILAAFMSAAQVASASVVSGHVAIGHRTVAPSTLHRPQGVDWPQLGFDAGHSAENPNETVISSKNVSQLQQVWSFPTGSGNNAGNVVEAGGVVYAPSANGQLFALDAATGTSLWSFSSGSGYPSSGSAAVADGGLVITVCNTSAGTQGICALNASSGAPVWNYTFPGSASYDGTPPVAGYGKVFFEACASSCAYVALDEQSGSVVWTVSEPQGSCEGNGGVTPAVAYKLLYVEYTCAGTVGGNIVGLRVKNGKAKWTAYFAPQNAGLSVAHNLLAVVFQAGSPATQVLYGYSPKKGSAEWDTGGPWHAVSISMPAVTKSAVYVLQGHELGAFTTGRGKLLWGNYPGMSLSSPSVANGVVYTACAGSPCAFDAGSGALLWSGPPSGAATYGTPIIANGVVYGACQGSNVCAWSLPSLRRR